MSSEPHKKSLLQLLYRIVPILGNFNSKGEFNSSSTWKLEKVLNCIGEMKTVSQISETCKDIPGYVSRERKGCTAIAQIWWRATENPSLISIVSKENLPEWVHDAIVIDDGVFLLDWSIFLESLRKRKFISWLRELEDQK
jgi:hypothetical protein